MEKNVLEFLENSQRMYGEKTACADMNNELTYTASFCQSHNFGRAVDALASGIVDGDNLVTGEFPLDDFYNGLDENVKDRNSIKVIIHPNTEE